MRPLSSAILQEQQKNSYYPAVKVALDGTHISGGSLYTLETGDNVVLKVEHYEAAVPIGNSSTSAQNSWRYSKILLNDPTNTYSGYNLRGYKVYIKYGFIISSVKTYPNITDDTTGWCAPLIVLNQFNYSAEGTLVVELQCVDRFALMDMFRVIGGVVKLTGTKSASFTLGETVTGGTSGASGIVIDGDEAGYILINAVKGCFEVETVTGGSSSSTLTSITKIEKIDSIGTTPIYNKTDHTKVIVGTCLNGLAPLVDQTDPALATTLYLDYHPLINNLTPNDTWGYLFRKALCMTGCTARPAANDSHMSTDHMHLIDIYSTPQHCLTGTPSGTFTLFETLTQATSGATAKFLYQTATYIVVDQVAGTFDTTNQITGGTSGKTITPTAVSAYDYQYTSSTHVHWTFSEGLSCPIPNEIFFVDIMPTTNSTCNYSGSAADATATSIGRIMGVYEDPGITSNTIAGERAANFLKHLQAEAYQGHVYAPMNVGQECWDYIKCTDARSGNNTLEGRVGLIKRVFDPRATDNRRRYYMEMDIGNAKAPVELFPALNGASSTDITTNPASTAITTGGTTLSGTLSTDISKTIGIVFEFDGGGSAIATDTKISIPMPFSCHLVGWTISCPETDTGAIKIDVWKDIAANNPPTNADTITNGHEPEIAASGTYATDTNISDWTTTQVAKGDVLVANVDSCTTLTKATLVLEALKL